MKHGEYHVDARDRDSCRRLDNLQGFGRPLLEHCRGGQCLRDSAAERPPAGLLDPDGDRLVLGGVEVSEDRRRRGNRHLMLARTASVNNADAKLFHLNLYLKVWPLSPSRSGRPTGPPATASCGPRMGSSRRRRSCRSAHREPSRPSIIAISRKRERKSFWATPITS